MVFGSDLRPWKLFHPSFQVEAGAPVVAVRIGERIVSVQVERAKGRAVVAVVPEGDPLGSVSHLTLSPFFDLQNGSIGTPPLVSLAGGNLL